MTPPAQKTKSSGKKPAQAGWGVSLLGNFSPSAVFRIFALFMVTFSLLFVFNNYLNFWLNWPGVPALLGTFGWFGIDAPTKALNGTMMTLSGVQTGLYLLCAIGVVVFVLATPKRSLHTESENLTAFTAYIARAVFWAVLLIGITDSVISFLRVEGLLVGVVGDDIAKGLGRSIYRGNFVHYPLAVASFIIAYFTRSLGFHWLALLIVIAEIQIVISRFIFSYEQAFMADLVRFWYGALFLFASAYTLVEEGHVRVDIFYAGFSERSKAWVNALGSLFLGLPLCWVILTTGMWGRSDVINGPMVSYEVTQAGYGLYVKYFLAGFLMVFAITMLIQFMGYFLSSLAVLLRERGHHPDTTEHANV